MATSTLDGLFQAVGVASILPFIALLADPSIAKSSPFFEVVSEYLPATLDQNLLFVTGLFAFAMLFISNALTVLDYWLSLKLFNQHRHRLSLRLLRAYMNKDTLEFNRRKTSEMSATVLSEVDGVVMDTLMAGAGVLTDLIVVTTIAALLIYVNPSATLVVLFCLGGGYLVIHLMTVRKMERLGELHATAEYEMFGGVSQALALYKEAKLGNKVGYFVNRFAVPSLKAVRVSNRYEMLTFLPVQALELLAFALMLGVALHFTQENGGPSGSIAIIAFYAFAAYRLIPVLTSLLDGFETFRYGSTVVENVLEALEEAGPLTTDTSPLEPAFGFQDAIELDNVAFRYPGNERDTFSGVNARIPGNAMTCISGPSGAGKSTLLDIISGLLKPSSGRMLIDGHELAKIDCKRWQRSIGYVPQQVQVLDGNVAENIALGEVDADMSRVAEVARLASIDQLVLEQLPAGYATEIGDGGYTLSSGERQRIGLARALYHSPDLLLLDEATNELDEDTESIVLERIANLVDMTIVFVTHKRRLWERADHLIRLPGRFG